MASPEFITLQKRFSKGVCRVQEQCDTLERRDYLLQKFKVFRGQFGGRSGHSCDVSARSSEALHKPHSDRITRVHDDRDLRCGIFCGLNRWRLEANDHVDFMTD